MPRFILPAALAACTLLFSVAASADDHRSRHTWTSDNYRYSDRGRNWDDRHDRRWNDRRGHDRHWDNRRGDRRWDHRRGDGRRWAVPPGHRYYYYPAPRRHWGYRSDWYGDRYYRYPSRYYYRDRYYYPGNYYYRDRDIHGQLTITVPIW